MLAHGCVRGRTGLAAGVVQVLVGPLGASSGNVSEQQAAQAALGSCLALAPSAVMPHALGALGHMLDRCGEGFRA